MTNTELLDCRAVCIFVPEEDLLNACQEMGVRGYLIDGDSGLVLIAPTADAQTIEARFDALSFERLSAVRVKDLPSGIRRLSRKTPTKSRGRIDMFDGTSAIRGWIHPDLAPDLRVQIFRGDVLIAEVPTDVFRPDLFEAGVGDGIAGFSCVLPDLVARRGNVVIRNADGAVVASWTDPNAAATPVPAAAAAAAGAAAAGAPVSQSPLQPAVVPAANAASRPASVATQLGLGEVPGAGDEGHYSVDLGGFALDYYLIPGKTNRMVVFSPGFLDAGRFPYPYFQRMKWAQRLEDTCVFLTDPTLLLGNTQIGWFVGDKTTHYLPVVAKYIETLAGSRGVVPADLLFFGSSAGGFSSIGFAAHVRGARALAVNPQTNALKLHSPMQLANTLRSCLGVTSLVDAYRDHKARLVLSEMFRRLEYVPRITIWQNFYDHYHVEHHLLPFLQEIKDLRPAEELDVRLTARPGERHDDPPDLSVIKHLFWP